MVTDRIRRVRAAPEPEPVRRGRTCPARPQVQLSLLPGLPLHIVDGLDVEERVRVLAVGSMSDARIASWLEQSMDYAYAEAEQKFEDTEGAHESEIDTLKAKHAEALQQREVELQQDYDTRIGQIAAALFTALEMPAGTPKQDEAFSARVADIWKVVDSMQRTGLDFADTAEVEKVNVPLE